MALVRSIFAPAVRSGMRFAVWGCGASALGKEVAPSGVRVIAIEPGSFRTHFAGRSLVGSDVRIEDYDATVGPRRKEADRTHGNQAGDPAKAAQFIIELDESADPPWFPVMEQTRSPCTTRASGEERACVDAWSAAAA